MLSEGWGNSNIGELVDILPGYAFKSANFSNDLSKGKPIIRIRDIQKHFPETVFTGDYLDTYLVNSEDILIGMDGDFHICRWNGPESLLNQRVCKIWSKKQNELNDLFLFYRLQPELINLNNSIAGTTVKHLSTKHLRNLEFPLPPLPEQNKIAAILSSVDDAIQATQAVIDQTRTVKQGLLQHLLIHGIGHTRFKQTEIGEIPEEWDVRKLRTVAHIQTGIAKGKKYLEDTIELPYLRVANVQEGYIDITKIKTINVSKREVERYSLQEGDVLLTEGGDLDKLGRGDVWHGQIEHCLHQNHVFAVRTDRLVILPEFYSAQASSFYGKKYFLSCAKQTTNLASINSTQLKDFPTIVPPLEEQNKIIKILYSVKKEEGLTKEYLDQLEKIKRGLMQDLLTGRVRVKPDEVDTT